ncbi:uncharacterized protein LOC144167845 [Haemaphysalis longicornis]
MCCSHQSGRFHTCYGMGRQCPLSMYFFHLAPPSNGAGFLLKYLIVHHYIDVIGPDRQTSWRDGTELLLAAAAHVDSAPPVANADIPGCSWHGPQAAASPHDHLLAAASPQDNLLAAASPQGHFLAAAAHQDCPTSPSSPRCFPAPATWNASSAASPPPMANADIPGCSWHGAQAAASPHDHLLAAASPQDNLLAAASPQGHFLAAAAHQDCPTSPSSPRCFPAPATWNASSAASPPPMANADIPGCSWYGTDYSHSKP